MENNSENKTSDSFQKTAQHDSTPEKSGRILPLPFVLAGGIVVSLSILYGNYLYAIRYEENILSWSGGPFSMIPGGAVLVGIFAGCGYGLFARILQYCPTKNFILTILIIQFASFFVGRYLEYRQEHLHSHNLSLFFQVYTDRIENGLWISNAPLAEPFTMGKWGYIHEFFTGVLFAVASLLSLILLWGIPYCKRCRLFMWKKVEVLLPASTKRIKLSKASIEIQKHHQQETEQMFSEAIQCVSPVIDLLKANKENSVPVIQFLKSLKKECGVSAHAAEKYWYVIRVRLWQCSRCDHYTLSLDTKIVKPDQTDTPRLWKYPLLPTIEYRAGAFTILSGFPETEA